LHKDKRAAQRDLKDAIQRESDAAQQANDWLALAQLAQDQQQYAEALSACVEVLRLQPNHPTVQRLRAQALLGLERHAEAGRALDLLPPPVPVEVHQARGLIHVKLREYVQAKDAFSRALALAPGNVEARVQRGLSYLMLRAPEAALADFEVVLKQEPDNALALCGRGEVFVRQGKVSEGVRDVEAALKAGPRSPQLRYNTACVYAQAVGRWTAPGQPTDRLTEARIRKCEQEAVRLLEEVLQERPAEQRATFWRDHIRDEPVFAPIRTGEGYQQLARVYGS
jgi:tetratricopeptide (TPR) repeat protein